MIMSKINFLITIFAYLLFLIIFKFIFIFKPTQSFNLYFHNAFYIFLLFPNYFYLIIKYLGLNIILNFYFHLVKWLSLIIFLIFSHFLMHLFFQILFRLNLNMYLNCVDIIYLIPIIFYFQKMKKGI